MNKSKGFTLIELLAVIVILAVIALIATPLIMGTITKAKRNSMKDTAYGILKAGEQYVGEKLLLAENDYNGETITLPNQNKIQYKGGNGLTGELQISKEGNLAIQIHNNQFCAIKNFGESEVTVTDYDEETCKLNDTPDSVSFATDSWETIVANVRRNPSVYHVGDTKEIELTGDYAGTYTLRLANTSTPAECAGTDFSQSACGFVVEFYDIITEEKMNSSDTNKDGWPGSELYQKLNPKNGDTTNSVIYNALPEDLKQVIVDTKVISGHGSNDSTNFTSIDKLYLLATKEIWGKDGTSLTINFDTSDNQTRQLDYYKSIGVTTNNVRGAIKQYQVSSEDWWMRSASSNTSDFFYHVKTGGHWDGFVASYTTGVAPAFRIG